MKVRESNRQVHRQYCHSLLRKAIRRHRLYFLHLCSGTSNRGRFSLSLPSPSSSIHFSLSSRSISLSLSLFLRIPHICTFSRLSNSATTTTTTTFSISPFTERVHTFTYTCMLAHTLKNSLTLSAAFSSSSTFTYFFSVCFSVTTIRSAKNKI